MKVLLLCGSIAAKSHTRAILDFVKDLFVTEGCEVNFWDLKNTPLPFALPEYHTDPTQSPDEIVKQFTKAVDDSQAIILGTPIYHGSYSGIIKNALDNLRADAFRGKWIGLIGSGSSVRSSHVEFSHLRQVVNTLFGYTAQIQIGTAQEDYGESGDNYVLVNEKIQQRCQNLVNELVGLTMVDKSVTINQ